MAGEYPGGKQKAGGKHEKKRRGTVGGNEKNRERCREKGEREL